MDLLRALFIVAFASTPALADSGESEALPSTFALGIGSSFSGQPVLVSQQWRSENAGIQYTLGIRWDRVSDADTANNVFAFDLGTWFLINIAKRGRTRATLLAGAEGSAVAAEGVRGGSALFGFGIQVQRRVTDTVGIYAQTGLSLSVETRAAQIRTDGDDPGEDSMRIRLRATPLELVSSLGLMWWLD